MCAHCLTIFRSKRKDLPRLNATANVQMPLHARRACIPLCYKANICDNDLLKIPQWIDILVVKIYLVCTGDSILHSHCRFINDNVHPLSNADWTHEAWTTTCSAYGVLICHTQITCSWNCIYKFYLVHLVVATQKCKNEMIILCLEGNCFDGLFHGNVQICRKQRNGIRMRCRDLFNRQWHLIECIKRTKFRLFIARRITAAIAAGNTGLPLGRNDGKLLGVPAANGTTVSLYYAKIQPATREYIGIRLIHLVIRILHSINVFIKGIKILHDKLTASHDTKTRPPLITEFILNLIEHERKLLVGTQLITHERRNHLFMGGAHTKLPIMAIHNPNHFRTVCVPTPAFLPKFRRLQNGH